MTLEKRDNWFKDYQEIPELGIKGQRKGSDRISLFRKKDFENSSVLDIGCYIGQMSIEVEKMGANEITSVEYDKFAFQKALEIKKKLNSKINYVLDDIDNAFFWRSLKETDVSLLLSVIDTQELQNKFAILSRLSDKTKKVLYLEGHNKQPVSKYFKMLIDYTNFSTIEYLGNIEDERVLIRCSRETLNSYECIDKILNCKFNKIAIVGKCNVGKSFIRQKIENEMFNKGYNVVDDLKIDNGTKWLGKEKIKNMQKVVLFDHKALEYVSDFDVIFFVSQNDLTNFRSSDTIVRSSNCMNIENVKEFFTVISR